MNISFERVTLAHREAILRYTMSSPYRTCDYSFANLFNWSEYYNTSVAFHKEMMLIRFQTKGGGRPACLMPVGPAERIPEVLADLSADFKEMGFPLLLMAVPNAALDQLKDCMCDSVHVIPNTDYTDYIYLREKLSTLSGKKLQSKRNHINRFKATYPDYVYEEITDANTPDCIALEEEWLTHNEQTDDLLAERKMVLSALHNREALGMRGGCIRVDGRVVAFTLGMPINADTCGISIEKANTEYDGAFAIINQEFASRIPEQYAYINREEDLGIEGLRQAKLSYRPEMLLEKKTVMIRCE